MGATGQTVLGIETSCDETAVAIVHRSPEGAGVILAEQVRSQLDEHELFGGVVPEIAARAHLDVLDRMIAATLAEARLDWGGIDAVAATAGPGLVGGLLVGLTMAKAIAFARDLPLVAVNHLEAHALTPGLTEGLEPPYLVLLVSGGHTQLLDVERAGHYRRLGTTLDDALGEAFDKSAKLLGLGYPGGPQVEAWAKRGDPRRFDLPSPMLGRAEAHFSFAGLKTAVRQRAQAIAPLSEQDVADLCASFQEAALASVLDRVKRGMALYEAAGGDEAGVRARVLVVSGGVAANRRIGAALEALCAAGGWRLVVPPARLCTDNAAMIAWVGAVRSARGEGDDLGHPVLPRWPLDATAPAAPGAGVKA